MTYRFGGYVLDPARRSLCSIETGQAIALTAKHFDTLRYLVEHRGQLVEKQALLDAVWPKVIVEEANLKQTISVLRRTLGDDSQRPRYIATISGRGYQFIAEVEARYSAESSVEAQRRDSQARPGERAASRKRRDWLAHRKPGFVLLGVLACAMALLLLDGYLSDDDNRSAASVADLRGDDIAPRFADRPAIAVLPFDVIDGDPGQQYLADGISEDLITRLAVWRSFPVIARNSSFVYRGRAIDVRQLGRELATRYLVEGSVRSSGNRLRISAQLIDASSGQHVWAATYDRELGDIFALQDEISEAIVAAMYPELVQFESARSMAEPPESLDAWEAAQRAWGHFLRLNADDNERAGQLFSRSVELDPGWSWSHAGLALTHYQRVASRWSESPGEDTAALLRLAEQAVALDDRDPAAHHALGHAYALAGRREEMIAAFKRGVALNPSDSIAHSCLGRNLAFAGRDEEAIEHLEQALRLSPRDPWTFLSLFGMAAAHVAAGRYDEAIDWARRSTQWRPNPPAYRALAVSYAQLGRLDEAREALGEMLRLEPDFALTDLDRVFASADPYFVKRVLDGLRLAGLEQAPAASAR